MSEACLLAEDRPASLDPESGPAHRCRAEERPRSQPDAYNKNIIMTPPTTYEMPFEASSARSRPSKWRTMTAAVTRSAGATLGVIFILVGIPIFPLPIPLGLPFITIGLILLMQSSPIVRLHILTWLHRHPRIYSKVRPAVRRTRMRRTRHQRAQARAR